MRGNVRMWLYRKDGSVEYGVFDNAIQLDGLSTLASWMINYDCDGSRAFDRIEFMEDSSTTVATVQGSVSIPSSGSFKTVATYTNNSGSQKTLSYFRLKDANDNVIAVQDLGSNGYTLNDGDSLKIEWTISFSNA